MLSEHLHEAEGHHEETFTDLLTSLPHWGLEVVSDLVFLLAIALFIKPVWKFIKTKLHNEIDEAHGISHNEPQWRSADVTTWTDQEIALVLEHTTVNRVWDFAYEEKSQRKANGTWSIKEGK